MKVASLVSVWDIANAHAEEATIGVNWCAIGPVTPRMARAFAREVLRVADRAEKARKRAQKNGWKLKPLPLSP